MWTYFHTGQNYDYELNEIFFDDLGIRKLDYLLSEGLPADMFIKTGSPMFEVLNTYRDGIAAKWNKNKISHEL